MNQKSRLLILITVFYIPFIGITQSINDSLLLHYPFNGNTDDVSGNGFNGISNATLAPDRFGTPNSAYSFNGINEYIDFPNLNELKPSFPLSVSMWVTFNDLSPSKSVFLTTCFALDNHAGIYMNGSQSGILTVSYGNASGVGSSARHTKLGTTNLQIGTWYHVVAIIRGQNDIDLYLNCENENGTYSGTASTIAYANGQGSLGRRGDIVANTYNFDGLLDDVYYWNRALTLNEIEALCNNSVSVEEKAQSSTLITAYPNPTSTELFLSGETDKIDTIQIYSSLGELVYETAEYNSPIDVSHFDNGVYFFHVVKSDDSSVQKVIIQ